VDFGFGLLIEKSEGRGDGWQGAGGADENIFYRCKQLITTLPKSKAADVISYQILKSATSIGANYREARGLNQRRFYS